MKCRIAEGRRNSLLTYLGLVIAGVLIAPTQRCLAQYYELQPADQHLAVVKASGTDSILFVGATMFDIPALPSKVELTYHEPLPDSVMPRAAIVVGRVTVQASEPGDVVERLEKFARSKGADWIVSFSEPRAFHDRAGNRLFRTSALLLHVLDPTLIPQSELVYSYYEESHLNNFAEVSHWNEALHQHLGAR